MYFEYELIVIAIKITLLCAPLLNENLMFKSSEVHFVVEMRKPLQLESSGNILLVGRQNHIQRNLM
jgi:hypothetical protein